MSSDYSQRRIARRVCRPPEGLRLSCLRPDQYTGILDPVPKATWSYVRTHLYVDVLIATESFAGVHQPMHTRDPTDPFNNALRTDP